jgi:predicted GIY-YIG superfamily endonuclease
MHEGEEGDAVSYPTPDELWGMTFAKKNEWRDRFADVPFEDKGGFFQGRYYQDIAIERVLEAMAGGEQRILLTLATGTGKNFIAFQLAWKLFQSRWNLSGEPTRRPRILFLTDRNILANQAFNSFSAFPEDALVRIAPDEIRKKGKVPKNGSIFFTIFQTFMASAGSATGTGSATGREYDESVNYREPDEIRFDELNEIRDAAGYMYILECTDGSFYTGSTNHLTKRLDQHRNGEGALHTKRRLPAKLIYYETFDHVAKAFEREKQVQGWSRKKKVALIRGDFSLG